MFMKRIMLLSLALAVAVMTYSPPVGAAESGKQQSSAGKTVPAGKPDAADKSSTSPIPAKTLERIQYLTNVTAAPNSGAPYQTPTVRMLQAKLKERGFDPGELDDMWGPKTEQAVKDFQTAQGLTADGIAGARTLAALGLIPQ